MICSVCGPTSNKTELKASVTVGDTADSDAAPRTLSLCDQCTVAMVKFLLDEHQRKTGVAPRVMLDQFTHIYRFNRDRQEMEAA